MAQNIYKLFPGDLGPDFDLPPEGLLVAFDYRVPGDLSQGIFLVPLAETEEGSGIVGSAFVKAPYFEDVSSYGAEEQTYLQGLVDGTVTRNWDGTADIIHLGQQAIPEFDGFNVLDGKSVQTINFHEAFLLPVGVDASGVNDSNVTVTNGSFVGVHQQTFVSSSDNPLMVFSGSEISSLSPSFYTTTAPHIDPSKSYVAISNHETSSGSGGSAEYTLIEVTGQSADFSLVPGTQPVFGRIPSLPVSNLGEMTSVSLDWVIVQKSNADVSVSVTHSSTPLTPTLWIGDFQTNGGLFPLADASSDEGYFSHQPFENESGIYAVSHTLTASLDGSLKIELDELSQDSSGFIPFAASHDGKFYFSNSRFNEIQDPIVISNVIAGDEIRVKALTPPNTNWEYPFNEDWYLETTYNDDPSTSVVRVVYEDLLTNVPQAPSNYVHMGVNHEDGLPVEAFWLDYGIDFSGKTVTITLTNPHNYTGDLGNDSFTVSQPLPIISDANGLESAEIAFTDEIKAFLDFNFDTAYDTQDSNIDFDVSISSGDGTIIEGEFTFSENRDSSTNTDYVNGWFNIKQPSIFNGLSGQESSENNFHFTLDTFEDIGYSSDPQISISVNDVPINFGTGPVQYGPLVYGDVIVDEESDRVTFRIFGDLKPSDVVKVVSIDGINNNSGSLVSISDSLTANIDFVATLNSVTYDNDAGELRLEFSEDMIESTMGSGLDLNAIVDGAPTGPLSSGYTFSGNTITVPASSLGINTSTLSIRSDITVSNISGIRDLQDTEFMSSNYFNATKVGFEPAIIPGGMVGSSISVAQILDSGDVRDEDQVYSDTEYASGDYSIAFNFNSVPGYSVNSSDFVFAIIDGQIAGYSPINSDGNAGIYIDGLEESDISAEDLRLGSAFEAELEIVIAEATEHHDSGDVPQIGTVYARTSASDPLILDLQDPAILKDYVTPPVDPNDDGTPGDPLIAVENLVSASDDFVQAVLAGEDGVIGNDDDGVLVTDVSTDTPSDGSINVIYVNDTDGGIAATYVGSAYTDFIIGTTDVVAGDSIEAGGGFDVMYNSFAYDHTNDSSKGLDVDLGMGSVTLNDGSFIDILDAEVELFTGTHLDDTFYGASGYSSLNGLQGFAPGGGRDYVLGDADSSVFTIVDYGMDDSQGAQGIVVITQDPADRKDIAYSTGNGSDIGEITDYWNEWIPYDETIVEQDGYILNESLQGYVGDAVILDHSGFADIVQNVDYYIGTAYADIMIGGNESDIFNADMGEGNYFDGGGTDDHDILMIEGEAVFEHLDIPDGSAIDYNTVRVERYENSKSFDLTDSGMEGQFSASEISSSDAVNVQLVAPAGLNFKFQDPITGELLNTDNLDFSLDSNGAANYAVDVTYAGVVFEDGSKAVQEFNSVDGGITWTQSESSPILVSDNNNYITSTGVFNPDPGVGFVIIANSDYTPPQPISYTIIAPDSVIDVLASQSLGDNYDVTAAYEIFASGNIAGWSSAYGYMGNSINVDGTELDISINTSADIQSLLEGDYLDLTIVQSYTEDFLVSYDSYAYDHDDNTGTPNQATHHSTIIRDVEEVVITEQAEQYLPNLASAGSYADVSGMFTDSYEYIGAGQGDLGDMLYVTTDQFISGTTGNAPASGFSVAGEIFYSGHHTDFNRNDSSLSNWAGAVAGALGSRDSNLWNEDVAEFFTMHTDSAENAFEVAVIYDTAKQTWRVNNEHFDTFQNVTIDADMAAQLSISTGQAVGVGDYRVFYSAAFKDINTVLEGNDGLTTDNWNFSFENFPSIPRSTFYIEVGGQTTGDNGDTGALGEALANITAVQVDWDDADGEFLITRDGNGSFPTPLVNLDTFLPAGLDLAADKSDTVIARDISENVKGGLGSDTLFGRGGADTYQIASGEAGGAANVFKNKDGSDIIGDIINEIGGKVSDDGDSVQFIGNTSYTTNISQFKFERTELRNEDEGNTLKITADYDGNGSVDDTVFLFDQYNEEQSFRQVEQLLLDDGWDPDEAWNLIVSEKDYYDGQDYLNWHLGTAGHDVMVAKNGIGEENWFDLNGEADLVQLGTGNDTISLVTDNYDYYTRENPFEADTTILGDVDWSAASDSGQLHQILDYVAEDDSIDFRFIGITEPDEVGFDVGIEQSGGNSYLYREDNAGTNNVEVLAEFVGVLIDNNEIMYDDDSLGTLPDTIL